MASKDSTTSRRRRAVTPITQLQVLLSEAFRFCNHPQLSFRTPEGKSVVIDIRGDRLLEMEERLNEYDAYQWIGVSGYRADLDEIFWRTAPGLEHDAAVERELLAVALQQYLGPNVYTAMIANPRPFLRAKSGPQCG